VRLPSAVLGLVMRRHHLQHYFENANGTIKQRFH
jgi:hypothetical protein